MKKNNILTKLKEDKHLLGWLIAVTATVAIAGSIVYLYTYNNKIYIEKSEIAADKIDLAAKTAGVLEETFVNAGDQVGPDTVVARVGTSLVKTDTSGTIISIKNNVGTLFAAGSPVVSMIEDGDLRVVGRLAEDKGLKDVQVGQTAMFKVDAFGSKKYYGIIDEISPTSRDSGVSFNISDKREVKEFNVKVRFDSTAYSELKNGMSAKIWIYKQ